MPNCCDAKLLQGLVRQARKNCIFYLFLAEMRSRTFSRPRLRSQPLTL